MLLYEQGSQQPAQKFPGRTKKPFAKREIFKNILRKFRRSGQQPAERSKGADKSAGEDSSVILMDTTKPDPAFEPTLLPDEDNMKLSTPSSEHPGTEVDLDSPITALMAVFGKSPLEIRTVISEHLLVVSEPIKDADKLIDLKSIKKTEIPHIGIANARILYTCRAIYEETLPFLYTRNTFLFRSPKRITKFGYDDIEGGDGILGPPTRFGLRDAPHERLSWIRSVVLYVEGGGLPLLGYQKETEYLLGVIWRPFFMSKSSITPLGFPALEKLTLDFSDWGLTAAEGDSLSLPSTVKKLNESSSLKRLTIKGIKEEQNLWDLHHGLVKEGGRFVVLDGKDRAVIDAMHKWCSQAAR